MFIIETSKEYDWPITVNNPVDGKFTETKFTVKFKKLTQTELTQMFSDVGDATDDSIARKIIVGWDESSVGAEFTDENLNSMLDSVGYATAIVHAYVESVKGILRKN